jgi:hypothetical protein
LKGFLEKEIIKENEIDILEPQETCDAPKPKEMIDLEVNFSLSFVSNNILNNNSRPH